LVSSGGADAYVVKLDKKGNWVWGQKFGEPTDDQGAGTVSVDGLGNVVVTGFFFTGITLGSKSYQDLDQSGGGFVVKLDAGGHRVWSEGVAEAGSNGIFINAAAIDPLTNDVVITGVYSGGLLLNPLSKPPPMGVAPLFIAKLTASSG